MIHETAIVDKSANIGKNVVVGAYSVVGPGVTIHEGTTLHSHVVVKVRQLSKTTRYSSSPIGEDCQDKKFAGEPTELIIGDNNIFRECATVHRGTATSGRYQYR